MYCANQGYKGRMGIHEVFPTPGDVQQAIAACESVEAMKQRAQTLWLPVYADRWL